MSSTRAERTATEPVARWRTRAFGIDIESSVAAPGLPPVSTARGPFTRLELVDAEALDRAWPSHDAERILEERFGRRAPDRTIDHHARAGYRLYARHFGLARISADGLLVECAPPRVAAWRWQRFLVGRLLPWAAVLRGRELLHASAVRFGERAVAFVGSSGSGKTSIAIRLVLRGAGFVTDDVLALERARGQVLAHPGAALSAIRPAEARTLTRRELRVLGAVVGRSQKAYVAVRREEDPLPLAAVCFLRRGGGVRIERVPPDPRLLLSGTFVASVRSRERLLNHLDVCGEIARTVPLFAVDVDSVAGSAALADALAAHIETTRLAA